MGRTPREITRSERELGGDKKSSLEFGEEQAQEPTLEKGSVTHHVSRKRRASGKQTSSGKIYKRTNSSGATAAPNPLGSKSSSQPSGGENHKIRLRKKRSKRLTIRKRARHYVFPKIRRKYSDELYRECLAACYQHNQQIREMRDEMKVLSLSMMWSARFPNEDYDTSAGECEPPEVNDSYSCE